MAKFEYQSDEWDDLSFPEGAVIKLVERIDSDWLRGGYKGQTGLFPQGYVDVIEDIAVKSPQVSPALSLVSNGTFSTVVCNFCITSLQSPTHLHKFVILKALCPKCRRIQNDLSLVLKRMIMLL